VNADPTGTLRRVVPYEIRQFGDPVLRQRAREVTEIDADLARIVETMLVTMHDAHGVGLAAPQVGVQKRVYTYDVDEVRERGGDAPGSGVLINPEIVEAHDEWTFEEGCLSVPGLAFEITRPKVVTVRGLDLDGNEVVLEGDELMGRVIQHEIDHLDGVLLLDRLEPAVRKEAMRELRARAYSGAAPSGGSHRL
jgi:peptide deformylase